MDNTTLFDKTIAATRNRLAAIIILTTFVTILAVSTFFFFGSDKSQESSEKIFTALIPLFATWIGTVLAFYFGRENFEAATNKYQEIINKLSPDVLDDIFVNQIMITRKTMVSMEYSLAVEKKVTDLVKFLDEVNKSRLPIIDKDEIKYIIHKSTFLDAMNKNPETELTFKAFEETQKDFIKSFIVVNENKVLEQLRSEMKALPNVQDVFVVDSNKKVVGWLTNTLILDYLKTR